MTQNPTPFLDSPVTDALMPTARRANLAFSHGAGAYLYGLDGRKYLDFLSGIAVTSLGHAHPHLVRTIQDQAGKLWHCSNLFRIPEQERLAERLTKAMNMDQAFFCNSGAEANEAAFKLIRKYFDDNGKPERFRVITFENAFHGRTLATLTATGQEKYLQGFYPKIDGFDQVAYGNLNALRAAITKETAAVMIEPIQGEGGIRAANPEFLQGIRKACDEFGLLLLYDQVQCGVGRSGYFCSHHGTGAEPDIITIAKGIAGGFPIGACLAKKHVSKSFTPGSHGTTFGGNPLGCAVANAVLDVVLADGFLDNVRQIGDYMLAGLRKIASQYPDVISEARGRGLILGMKCVVPNAEMMQKLRENGLLTNIGGDNVIRLLPPLIIGKAESDEALRIIESVCENWKSA